MSTAGTRAGRSGSVVIGSLEVELPASLDAREASLFTSRLRALPIAGEYVFDFRRLEHLPVYGMLLVSSAIRRFQRERTGQHSPTPQFHAVNYSNTDDGHTYAAHMGFFKACGIEFGRSVGEAWGSDTYLPLSKLTTANLLQGRRYSKSLLAMQLDTESKRLATILARNMPTRANQVFAYSLREMMRNVFEHSRATEVWYGAQFRPQLNRIEIAIADEGIGIKDALRENPAHLDVVDDTNAIRRSLVEGASGAVGRPVPLEDRYNPDLSYGSDESYFENSGYGLYVVSSLCRAVGDFLVCSNSRSIKFSGTGEDILETSHSGTIVRLVIYPSSIEDQLEKLLADAQLKAPAGSARASASLSKSLQPPSSPRQ